MTLCPPPASYCKRSFSVFDELWLTVAGPSLTVGLLTRLIDY
jgi:hypothetical protein